MDATQYAEALMHARLSLKSMLVLFPGGLTALIRYERLLSTAPASDE